MERQIRICVVSPLYHPNLGGVGRQALALTEQLYRAGISVFVICRDIKELPQWQPQPGLPVIKIPTLGRRRHDLEEKTFMNLLISLNFCFGLMLALIRNRKNYDIVHFHGASLPLILNVLLLKLLKKRVIAKVAGAKMDIEAGSFKGRYLFIGDLFIRMLRHVDMFVAISKEIKEDLMKDGFDPEKISEISNFIKPGDFHPEKEESKKKELKKKLGLTEDRKILTFSGRLVQRKRVDVLLRAVSMLVKERQDIQVIILGHGELIEDLQSLAAELGITEYISFLSFVSNILDYLQATDIFIFPSEKEGMPNALLEAMACGLPVVAARIGGVVDIIKDRENGLLFTAGDADGLKDSIMALIKDPDLSEALADRAYQTIKECYYIDKAGEKYISLYSRVLNAV